MMLVLIIMLLIEALVCVVFLKKSAKINNYMHEKNLRLKRKNKELQNIIIDTREACDWAKEELEVSKAETTAINSKLDAANKEIERLKNESLILSLELQKAMTKISQTTKERCIE